jgi:predicted membrane protein
MNKTFVFVPLIFLFASCNLDVKERMSGESEDAKTFEKTIERNRVQKVRTEIKMNAGVLQIKGGSNDLVNARIKYTREDWKPVISYATRNDQGKLLIEQPESGLKNINFGDDDTNRWEITLNEDVKQDMYLTVGAGSTEVDLKGFQLNLFSLEAGVGEYNIDLTDTSVPEVDVNAGVGEVNLNLTGKWKNDLRAEINGGIGELNLILPADVGIQLEIHGGLGSVDAPGFHKEGNYYSNEVFGSAKYEMTFEINGGLGGVNVSLVK